MYKTYYVYMMTNKTHSVLYTGMTNNLRRRVYEHKSRTIEGFTSRYKVHHLVYFETYSDINDAIRREKTIKNLLRRKKDALVNEFNPEWRDLMETKEEIPSVAALPPE